MFNPLNDKEVDRFEPSLLTQCKMALVTLYDKNTRDYPNKYVARLFNLDQPTNYIILSESLDELKRLIPNHMVGTAPNPNDPKEILGVFF